MKAVFLSITIFCVLLLQGCMVLTIGTIPSNKSPKIVLEPTDVNFPIWDSPASAFGPIADSDFARGESACASLNRHDIQYKAIGYHPKALDIDGKPFAGGGFYCVKK